MVDVFDRSEDAVAETLLTEWVQLNITLTNLLPRRTVTFVFLISPSVLFVLPIDYCFMLLTVQSVSQLRTVGVITRFLWFSRHRCHFLLIITGMKNAILSI